MHGEAEESAAGAGAEDLRREAEGAAGAVRTMRVGDERERAARLSLSLIHILIRVLNLGL